MSKNAEGDYPDGIYQEIKGRGGRAQKIENLTRIHELCRAQYVNGNFDFSISSVGRVCEAAGIIKGRALYNLPSADYRTLIQAWSDYSKNARLKKGDEVIKDRFLLNINDPAIRMIVQKVLKERDDYKAQLTMLRSQVNIVIDRRQPSREKKNTVTIRADGVEVVETILNATEKEALRKSIAEEFFSEQGWVAGSHGEVFNENGRVIFDVGFTKAIKKVLKEYS
jgi:hypothetical protein